MAFELPSAVYSPELLVSVVYEIEEYVDWYRAVKIQKKVGAKATEEPTHSAETALVIEAWSEGKPVTLESLEKLVGYLKRTKLPVVHLTLAALPNHTQRTALVDWFRTNTSPQVLVAFTADRAIGGGVMVRTPNRVFDYSWRQRLLDGREKVAGIVHRV